METFFITGLPRSRTAWLANFFTHGPSFCYHDRLCENPDLGKAFADVGTPYVGLSDSGAGLVWPRLLREFPTAKMVVVWRPIDACIKSFMDHFTEHPYKGMDSLDDRVHTVESLFRVMERRLRDMLTVWPRENLYEVQYDALDKELVCDRLWRFILPETPFPLERWKQLNFLCVNPASDKRKIPAPEEVAQMLSAV